MYVRVVKTMIWWPFRKATTSVMIVAIYPRYRHCHWAPESPSNGTITNHLRSIAFFQRIIAKLSNGFWIWAADGADEPCSGAWRWYRISYHQSGIRVFKFHDYEGSGTLWRGFEQVCPAWDYAGCTKKIARSAEIEKIRRVYYEQQNWTDYRRNRRVRRQL